MLHNFDFPTSCYVWKRVFPEGKEMKVACAQLMRGQPFALDTLSKSLLGKFGTKTECATPRNPS
jgi:hypothetical protein